MHLKHILVATDFGEASTQAVAFAAALARQQGAALTVFHAYELPVYGYEGVTPFPIDVVAPVREHAQRLLDQCTVELRKDLPDVRSALCAGPAWQGLLEAAQELPADLIVVGTHGRRGLAHALLGSVAEKVVRLSTVPVVTVPSRGARRASVARAVT